MNRLTDRPPLTQTDKLCMAAFAGVFLTANLAVWVMDCAAYRAAGAVTGVDKPPVAAIVTEVPIDCTRLIEAAEAFRADPYNPAIPLARDLQKALREACEAHTVPVSLALGLIQVESSFDPEAVSPGGDYGLCQLNPRYFPSNLTPAENLQAGVGYLGKLLEQYDGDIGAALTAYNAGHDTGSRSYSNLILNAEKRWRDEA